MTQINMDTCIPIALLYRKIFAGTDMISFNSISKFKNQINENLALIESDFGYKINQNDENTLYYVMLEENKIKYAVLRQDADIELAINK